MILAVTGHRPNRLNNEYDGVGPCSDYLREQLRKRIIQYQASKLISGMALGVDMLFAELGIEMQIPVVAAVPCDGQQRIWPTKSQERWQSIIDQAEKVEVVSPGGYASWKMQVRNKWMCDNSELLIACWDGSLKGGTANCVQYAKKINKKIEVIDPTQWEQAA